MELKFDQSFEKALDKLKDKNLFRKIEALISSCENATALQELKNTKKSLGTKITTG